MESSMTKVLVATTLAAFKAMPDRPVMESEAWLTHGDAWRAAGHEFFAALQIGQGHDEDLLPLHNRLLDLGAEWWTFAIGDGLNTITGRSRLKAICMGRNLIHEYFNERQDLTHLLLLDSDMEPPPEAIDRLVEVDHPIVAGHCPTYCLDGPKVVVSQAAGGLWMTTDRTANIGPLTSERPFPEGADVRSHWSSAGCWMLTRAAARRIRWGWDLDGGMTDDPFTADLAKRVGLGQMWTRHDVQVIHHPQSIGPLETRGHDLSVQSNG
jgi:hypothetical protein